MTAGPGTRDYGYLSVVVQTQAEARMVCRVPAAAFRPPPKVESAVVTLDLRPDAEGDLEGFLDFVGTAFRHKRKTLRNNLRERYANLDAAGSTVLGRRAEQLSIAELRALWKAL
jgi:16S rRNA (adenine1518-N6/adenine1519-N6)-dimethyltransferase